MKSLREFVDYLKAQGFSERILEAFSKIDRKFFVPEEYKDLAYEDTVIPLKDGVTISQPTVLAHMLDALEVESGLKVLEIGTGSGYSTALLSYLVGEKGSVVSVEIDRDSYEYAREKISKLIEEKVIPNNVKLVLGDGSLGYPREAPYDRIIAHAACSEIPNPWIWQLRDNGIIVAPVGVAWSQKLTKLRKKHGKLEKTFILDVVFVPLRGKFGEL